MAKSKKKEIQIKELIKFSWAKVKKHAPTLLVLFTSLMLLHFVGGWFLDQLQIRLPLLGFIASIAWFVLMILVSMGIIRSGLYFIEDKEVNLDTFRSSRQQVINYLLGEIYVAIIVILGFLALIIPGIYLALRYQFVSWSIVDKNMTATEAMEASSKMTENIKLKLLLFLIVIALMNAVAGMLFGIGLIVTVPVSYLAYAKLYSDLK